MRDGDIRHFFLIGGCDAAAPGRNDYTEFAEAAPKDTMLLTLGCGKYRFNHEDFGHIGAQPITTAEADITASLNRHAA